MTAPSLTDARSALAECEVVVGRLHKMCCDPDRSPQMAEIEDSLLTVRQDLAAGDPMALDRALDRLADLGAKIGRLQVGCCAPIRMPLYAEALAHLNTIQLRIVTVLGLAH